MRQAIVTKYLGPTDHRGSRIVAQAHAGRITVAWDYALGVEQNHTAAAVALAQKMGWHGTWVGGALPDGYAFCHALEYTSVTVEQEGES